MLGVRIGIRHFGSILRPIKGMQIFLHSVGKILVHSVVHKVQNLRGVHPVSTVFMLLSRINI